MNGYTGPRPFPDLPGEISVNISDHAWIGNSLVMVSVVQKLAPGVTYGAVCPLPPSLLEDSRDDLRGLLEVMTDRVFRPWRHIDSSPMPRIVLFPRLARLSRRWA